MSEAPNIDYEALEAEKSEEVRGDLTLQLKAKTNEAGRIDSLKRTILSYVASESYDSAKENLEGYINFKTEFPLFQERSQRYKEHCMDLIQAIQLKRNFPGITSLSFAKQQEIHESVIQHFEELKMALNSIQKIERELKLEDLRSTTWFLKTLNYSLLTVATVGFLVALKSGLGQSFYLVVDRLTDQITTFLIELFPF